MDGYPFLNAALLMVSMRLLILMTGKGPVFFGIRFFYVTVAIKSPCSAEDAECRVMSIRISCPGEKIGVMRMPSSESFLYQFYAGCSHAFVWLRKALIRASGWHPIVCNLIG